jgi:hypothetical protein
VGIVKLHGLTMCLYIYTLVMFCEKTGTQRLIPSRVKCVLMEETLHQSNPRVNLLASQSGLFTYYQYKSDRQRAGLQIPSSLQKEKPGSTIPNALTKLILLSLLREVHSLFKNEFSRVCHQVLHLSIFSILFFP